MKQSATNLLSDKREHAQNKSGNKGLFRNFKQMKSIRDTIKKPEEIRKWKNLISNK